MTISHQFRFNRLNPAGNDQMNPTNQNSLQIACHAACHLRGVQHGGRSEGFFTPMNKLTDTPKPCQADDGILIKLLQIEDGLENALEGIDAWIQPNNPFSQCLDQLLDIVLDALGVPPDTTVEHGFGKESFCRDVFYFEWLEIRNGNSSRMVEHFPEWVRQTLAEINSPPRTHGR